MGLLKGATGLTGTLSAIAQPIRQLPVLESPSGIEHRRNDNVSRLDQARRRLSELKDELARPFEHEQRLGDLLARQRALAKSLDLDKDETGTEAAADVPESEARGETAANERLAA